ncbi:hypothetical protein [Halalkalibacter sp. APA_J-10(15)]|uniref:hypothetical protein n=1 Tax=Halalkalibacter sp. APA_J-10(15) TaxID=2933805 RepID=UPI001FF2BEB9|nr:hypothetical protein [Halalkalibacter sp. APA_J-10(15)]MCK0472328.1 hypothetical protein [Halalkalibacter sp. APA_J-10(15)]
MEKGIFAKYMNKIYRVSNIDGDTIRLVSEDRADLKNEFKEKIYPINYKDRSNLPRLYIKEIKKAKIDEIYEIDYKAKYKGNILNLSINKVGTELRLGTTDTEFAKNNGFERTDKYYYEKTVNQDEIEIIKIKKNL